MPLRSTSACRGCATVISSIPPLHSVSTRPRSSSRVTAPAVVERAQVCDRQWTGQGQDLHGGELVGIEARHPRRDDLLEAGAGRPRAPPAPLAVDLPQRPGLQTREDDLTQVERVPRRDAPDPVGAAVLHAATETPRQQPGRLALREVVQLDPLGEPVLPDVGHRRGRLRSGSGRREYDDETRGHELMQQRCGHVIEVLTVVGEQQQARGGPHRPQVPHHRLGQLGQVGRTGEPEHGPERPQRDARVAGAAPDSERGPALTGRLVERFASEPRLAHAGDPTEERAGPLPGGPELAQERELLVAADERPFTCAPGLLRHAAFPAVLTRVGPAWLVGSAGRQGPETCGESEVAEHRMGHVGLLELLHLLGREHELLGRERVVEVLPLGRSHDGRRHARLG